MLKATKKLPGEDLPQEVDDAPFSDSEEQLKTMEPADHELYMKLKGYMNGNHANEDEIMDYVDGEKLVNKCFQVAVERLMPGHGRKFALCIKSNGGAYGEADEQAGATYQMAYIKYLPTHYTAGGVGLMPTVVPSMCRGETSCDACAHAGPRGASSSRCCICRADI